jgi:hypothetical protein
LSKDNVSSFSAVGYDFLQVCQLGLIVGVWTVKVDPSSLITYTQSLEYLLESATPFHRDDLVTGAM